MPESRNENSPATLGDISKAMAGVPEMVKEAMRQVIKESRATSPTPKETRYPRQITSAGRKGQILSVDDFQSLPTAEDDIPPLELHSGFSRFVVTLIDKTGNEVITPKANIPVDDVPLIQILSRMAMQEKREYTKGKKDTAETPAAFAHAIRFGEHKGRTPGDILLEDPSKRDALQGTLQFLKGKFDLSKEMNVNQVKAIESAIELLDSGKLEQDSGGSGASSFVIYHEQWKYMKDTNALGHRRFYQILVRCNYAMDNPWELEIINTFAPFEKKANNRLAPKMDEKSEEFKSTICLTDREWMRIINKMARAMNLFEQAGYPAMYKQAIEIARKHAIKSKEGDATAPPTSKAA